MNGPQYAVNIGKNAEAVYCDLYGRAFVEGDENATRAFTEIDRALEVDIPARRKDPKIQLAGKLSQIYRLKLLEHRIDYTVDDATSTVNILCIAPFENHHEPAYGVWANMVMSGKHKKTLELLGCSEHGVPVAPKINWRSGVDFPWPDTGR